jgi:hypothetical protein
MQAVNDAARRIFGASAALNPEVRSPAAGDISSQGVLCGSGEAACVGDSLCCHPMRAR